MAGPHTYKRRAQFSGKPGAFGGARAGRVAATLTVAWLTGAGALAAPPGAGNAASATIYSCIDSSGHRLSSDRPIPECMSQDQKILGRDGSTRKIVPPYVSREEQERMDAQRRALEKKMAAQKEQERQDRALLARYPNGAAHDAARQATLQPLKEQILGTRERLVQLESERNALAKERAGFGFKTVPDDLKYRSNINEGSIEAVSTILRRQELELERMNQQLDAERGRLQQLWAGAAPGSLPGESNSNAGSAAAAAATH